MKLLIVGCGYVGCVVRSMVPKQWTVFALTRSEGRQQELKSLDIVSIVGSWHDLSSLKSLPVVDLILIAIPHRPEGEFEGLTHRNGLANLLTSLAPGWSKLVYLSTTGVYGNGNQEMVNEDTPTAPKRLGPQIAVQAEQWLQENLSQEQHTVLRLAGIYGPGRVPLANKIRTGEPLAVPRSGFLNLVHVVDIARLVHWVLLNNMHRACYVLSDGQPVLRTEFYEYLAKLCGSANPVFTEPDEFDSRAQRATSKRIDPSRILNESKIELEFPDYRLGLVNALGL